MTNATVRVEVFDADGHFDTYGLCSLHCLIEYAWKLREKQPKLSKSKQ